MEAYWYVIQFLKPIAALGVGILFPKCFLPLKQGLEQENQKLINRGSSYLILSIFFAGLFVYLFTVA